MEDVRLIRSEKDYQAALKQIRALWDAEPGTPEEDQLEILSILVSKYEEEHFPIEEPDPIEYIKVRMEELGLRQEDLVPYMGNKGNVSKVLNRKRSLSLEMIRNLHRGLRFPLEVLIGESSLGLRSNH
ncbi:helix-turn-helix domain-containing protein [Pontibacter anaerobius]|uniref:Transcriptional regulator n=1 Tax=Pontibacter anaerobius TaxID=2993940 RepID=A0ABT3RDK0_9BACT|nr:transcriptional regulator [Pontibacter anaerobius]MCX2739498.1 transcriptional regulator [Pontibacter anaerobius]